MRTAHGLRGSAHLGEDGTGAGRLLREEARGVNALYCLCGCLELQMHENGRRPLKDGGRSLWLCEVLTDATGRLRAARHPTRSWTCRWPGTGRHRRCPRLAHATQRDGLDERLDDRVGQRVHHVGVGDARGHGVHADLVLGQLAASDSVSPFTANLLVG